MRNYISLERSNNAAAGAVVWMRFELSPKMLWFPWGGADTSKRVCVKGHWVFAGSLLITGRVGRASKEEAGCYKKSKPGPSLALTSILTVGSALPTAGYSSGFSQITRWPSQG